MDNNQKEGKQEKDKQEINKQKENKQEPHQKQEPPAKKNTGLPDFEAELRQEIHSVGFGHGKASVRPLHGVEDAVRNAIKKPDPVFFTDYALRYENKMLQHIKELKDEAVKKRAQPDSLKDITTQETYSGQLSKKIEDLHADEFYGKSLLLYIIFALLLCLGDILMGDYLAKEVLLAGPDAGWKGILLGLFCIALGVILEVLINAVYYSYKKVFTFIISLIPLITILMFVGMGVLRATSVNVMSTGRVATTTTIFPPWTVNFFFIGMSLAALTALGCVLFVIQKKLLLIKQIRRTRITLEKLGAIINAEQLLANNKASFAKDLSAEYDIGFNKGREEEIFKGPPPKPKPEPQAASQGSLVDRLKIKMLEKKGFQSIMIMSLATLLVSCNTPTTKNNSADCLVYLGLAKEDALKVLDTEIEKMEGGTAFAVIWPGGIESYDMSNVPGSSLIAKPVVNQQITENNKEQLDSLKKRFRTNYKLTSNNLPVNWRESSFRLLALVSEQFQGTFKKKKISLWLGAFPDELLIKTDSLILSEARSDATNYTQSYSFHVNQLANADINIYIPVSADDNDQLGEVLRRTRRYYRELFAMFDAVLLSVKTVNI